MKNKTRTVIYRCRACNAVFTDQWQMGEFSITSVVPSELVIHSDCKASVLFDAHGKEHKIKGCGEPVGQVEQ